MKVIYQRISFFILSLYNDSTVSFSSKNSNDFLSNKLSQNNRSKRWWSFLITELPVLVITPLHNITNIEQSNTMAISTLNLINGNFLLFTLYFQHIIWQFFHFHNVIKMSYLIYAELTPKVSSESIDLIALCLSILANNHIKLTS